METVGWGGLWDAHPSPSWKVGDKVNRADLTKLGTGCGSWDRSADWGGYNMESGIGQTRLAGPWCWAVLA